MPKLDLKKATTSVTVYIFIQNSSVTTGAGLTGLVFNSAGLVAYYVRPLGSATAITLVTQTVTGAWSSGGFVEIDATNMPGLYRLDLPDAVSATGVNSVVVMLKGATNMAPVLLELELTGYDPYDAVRAGLTALPNAAAQAAGGLYTQGSGAGQINQSANGQIDINVARWLNTAVATPNTNGVPVVDTRTISRFGTAQAGAATTITLDASASATTDFYKEQQVYIISGTGAGESRVCTAYNGTTKVATVTPAWATNPDATSVFAVIPAAADIESWEGVAPNALIAGRVDASIGAVAAGAIGSAAFAANALGAVWDELLSSHTTAGTFGRREQIIRDNTAQAGAAGTITLDTGASAVTDFYKDQIIFIVAGTGVGQARICTAYNGTTKVATINPNWATNPDATSIFVILPFARVAAQVWDEVIANHLTAGSTGNALNNASAPTVQQVVNGVWDEAIASHLTAGSTGAKLNSAAASADPLSNAVPGSYAAGTAGKILGSIGSGSITTVSPVLQSGNVEVTRGMDFLAADGEQLDWTESGTGTAWPDLTAATITFAMATGFTAAGSVITPTGTSKKVRVELSRAQTLDPQFRTSGGTDFNVKAQLGNGHTVILVRGTIKINPEITP